MPYEAWLNELKIDRVRATTFVWEGLRPYFPEDWAKDAVSYFRSSDGKAYRYVDTPSGTQFVRGTGDNTEMVYGRVTGVYSANTKGNISNWAFYNGDGPAGLNPDRYYPVWPDVKRPAVHLGGIFTDAFVNASFVNDTFLVAEFAPYEPMHNIRPNFGVQLYAPAEPALVKVNGRAAKLRQIPDTQAYNMGMSSTSDGGCLPE